MTFDCSPTELCELAERLLSRLRRGCGRGLGPGSQPKMFMTRPAYEQGLVALNSYPPEFALFLIGPVGHRAVTHVVADTTGEGTPVSFHVGAKRLNEVLGRYTPLGLEGKGFWHSHPPDCERLSPADLAFVRKQFSNPKNDGAEILMPIISGGRVVPFIVRRDRPDRPLEADLVLI